MFPSLSGKTFIRTLFDCRSAHYLHSYCFHPFQGRPSFGHFPNRCRCRMLLRLSFHPFQGRPLFGLIGYAFPVEPEEEEFPSLSGKTSIRTRIHLLPEKTAGVVVSIPFREDLYSDIWPRLEGEILCKRRFHPFQGRPLFGRLDITINIAE